MLYIYRAESHQYHQMILVIKLTPHQMFLLILPEATVRPFLISTSSTQSGLIGPVNLPTIYPAN